MSVENSTVVWQGSTKDIEFSYADFKGNKTRRKVQVNKVLFDKDKQQFYINGICQERNSERDFKENNISTMIKVGSNRYDFQEWLTTLDVDMFGLIDDDSQSVKADPLPITEQPTQTFSDKLEEYNRKQQKKFEETKANQVDTPAQAKARKLIKPLFISIGVLFIVLFLILLSSAADTDTTAKILTSPAGDTVNMNKNG
ncbi:hypothetical protein [Shewanella sp. 30m-9]